MKEIKKFLSVFSVVFCLVGAVLGIFFLGFSVLSHAPFGFLFRPWLGFTIILGGIPGFAYGIGHALKD